jgi:hypothetical protein
MKKIINLLIAGFLSTAISAQYRNPEEKLNDSYCTGLFKNTDGTILDVASQNNIGAYLNILEWLNGRVSGLQVYTSRTGVVIPIMRGSIPNIFIDEQQVSASTVSSLNVHDIAMVKVIKQPFLGGFDSSGGAIAIYTVMEEEDEQETGAR